MYAIGSVAGTVVFVRVEEFAVHRSVKSLIVEGNSCSLPALSISLVAPLGLYSQGRRPRQALQRPSVQLHSMEKIIWKCVMGWQVIRTPV